MKEKYKLAYMKCAEAIADCSEAVRKKVGCILVDENGVISEGLNGMPPEWESEECEYKIYSSHRKLPTNDEFPYRDEDGRHRLVTKPECRHAEEAALEKLWKKPNSANGAKCFVTLSPCLSCAIKLKTAGIKEVYYREEYRDSTGLNYLRSKNIKVEKI
jgi:dCMP deaminase